MSGAGPAGGVGRVTVAVVPWDGLDLTRLCDEQQAELVILYDGDDDTEPRLPPEEMLATVLVRVGGAPAGCGALRDASRYGVGFAELKRMHVRPGFRRRGLSRLVLAELERIAVERGLARLVLETGVRQVAAVGLCESAGYRRIPNFGPHVAEPRSLCYARWLTSPAVGRRPLVWKTSRE